MDTTLSSPALKSAASHKKKRSIFKNATQQDQFNRDGYVVLDFLHPDAVKALYMAYEQLQGDLGRPAFASTIMSRNPEYRRAVSALIEEAFSTAIDQLFIDAKPFWGNFNLKYPNNNLGTVPLHQDHSCIDERSSYALVIWVPLVDTTTENGALHIIPGSHTFIDQPRCGGRPFPYATSQAMLLQSFGKLLPMRAGQAYVGHPGLFHGSLPNAGNEVRIAAAGLVGPKEGRLVYYNYKENDGGGIAEKFEVDHDYYVTAPLFSRPDPQRYRLLEEIPLNQKLPSVEQIVKTLSAF